jgi:Ca2+-binding RTX toxin-like protein
MGTSIGSATHLVGVSMSIADGNLMVVGNSPDSLRWFYGEFENALGSGAGDYIIGNIFDNQINGFAGADIIYGGLGADTIYGGIGNDNLTGGSGSDTFVFSAGDGSLNLSDADIINDFLDGTDFLKLSGSLQFGDLTISQGNGTNTSSTNTIIMTSSNEYLAVLLNTQAGSLNSNDFLHT